MEIRCDDDSMANARAHRNALGLQVLANDRRPRLQAEVIERTQVYVDEWVEWYARRDSNPRPSAPEAPSDRSTPQPTPENRGRLSRRMTVRGRCGSPFWNGLQKLAKEIRTRCPARLGALKLRSGPRGRWFKSTRPDQTCRESGRFSFGIPGPSFFGTLPEMDRSRFSWLWISTF